MSASAHHRVEPRSDHARAVLFVCDLLTAQGATVIAANTDEAGEPQIFAQSDAGELAFYLVRAGLAEPDGGPRFALYATPPSPPRASQHPYPLIWNR